MEKKEIIEKEMVNKVDHYGGTMVMDFIKAWEALPNSKANFARTTAFKYLFRAGMKYTDKEIQDLEKLLWYIKDDIERLKNENSQTES